MSGTPIDDPRFDERQKLVRARAGQRSLAFLLLLIGLDAVGIGCLGAWADTQQQLAALAWLGLGAYMVQCILAGAWWPRAQSVRTALGLLLAGGVCLGTVVVMGGPIWQDGHAAQGFTLLPEVVVLLAAAVACAVRLVLDRREARAED